MHELDWWTRRQPAEKFDLADPAHSRALWSRYAGTRRRVFGEVLRQVMNLGGASAILEYRYLDPDYRNEHSRFYSTTFRRYPSVAHRAHFFANPVEPGSLTPDRPTQFSREDYLGYVVFRPVPASPVGRSVLRPPASLKPHVSCIVSDEVNLFGSQLWADGAPFMSQDSQLGVCVHVTAWLTGYYHYLRFRGPRYLPGDIAAFTPHELGRLLPASHMSIGQLTGILEELNVPPIVYDLQSRPPGESLETIAARYLNSGFPVVAAGGSHAFVLVGYRQVDTEDGKQIQFIRQDDQAGPYQVVANPALDVHRPWQYLVIPLPAKVYVSGEKAEIIGREKLAGALGKSRNAEARKLRAELNLPNTRLAFRTTARLSNDFKTTLGKRGYPDIVVGAYQWMHLSRWVWIVELVDRDAWQVGSPCVLAEAVIDATDHTDDPHVLAWRVPGAMYHWRADSAEVGELELEQVDATRSAVLLRPKS